MAHELPQRVAVRMLVSVDPVQQVAHIMVRVPLEAMRDVDFPLDGPGYLRIEEARDPLTEAAGLWIVDEIVLRVRGEPVSHSDLQTRLALPASRAFDSLDSALQHFESPPLDPATRVYWRQALLDLKLRYPLPESVSARDLSLDVALQHLGVRTRVDLLYVDANGEETRLSFDGHADQLALEPGALRVAGDFLQQGVVHILGGIDHLLFLVCLALPIRRLWPLIKTVTAFTVAHSITLAAAALGYVPNALWFPALVESIIALSIVLLAIENVLLSNFRHRPAVATVFGLAHGFGFSFALAESLPFAQGQNLVALASFNLGVELGQIAVLLVIMGSLHLLIRWLPSERALLWLISLLVGHTGWHWMTERLEQLAGYW